LFQPPETVEGDGSSPALRISGSTVAELMTFRIWGNRLGDAYGVTLTPQVAEVVSNSGYRFEMPNNVWGDAQHRDQLNVDTGTSCGGVVEMLVDPVRSGLPAEPTGSELSGGVFRDNVFSSPNIIGIAQNLVSLNDRPNLKRPQHLRYAPLARTTARIGRGRKSQCMRSPSPLLRLLRSQRKPDSRVWRR